MMIINSFCILNGMHFPFLHVTKMSILKREIGTLHTVLIFFAFCQSSITQQAIGHGSPLTAHYGKNP